MTPMTLPDDLPAIRAAVKSLGNIDVGRIKIMRIKNTITPL